VAETYFFVGGDSMMKGRAAGARSFSGEIQIVRVFRGIPETVDAVISYDLVGGVPVFKSVCVGQDEIPMSYTTTSDLLRAYAKRSKTF
jgi:hypothetical protein